MMYVNPVRLSLIALAPMLAMLAGALPSAQAQLQRRLSFEEMVNKSDHILIARCAERHTSYKNGTIVTEYRLKPVEFWKGGLRIDKDGAFGMQELGGAIEQPLPLELQAPGMADIKPDEEVLLFAVDAPTHDKSGQPQRLGGAIRVLGMDQGRFSVISNPETGEKLVARRAPAGLNDDMQEHANRAAMARLNKLADDDGAGHDELSRRMQEKMKQDLARKLDSGGARAKARRDLEATRDARRGEDIFQFESLDALRARVLERVEAEP